MDIMHEAVRDAEDNDFVFKDPLRNFIRKDFPSGNGIEILSTCLVIQNEGPIVSDRDWTSGTAETGLGLDIVRRTVEETFGGTVTFRSKPGETVFEVWLPLDKGSSVTEAS